MIKKRPVDYDAASSASKRFVDSVADIKKLIDGLPAWNSEAERQGLIEELTFRVCQRWFEHSYEIPSTSSSRAAGTTAVLRSTLQRQINSTMEWFGLPVVRRNGDVWRRFLIQVVKVPEKEVANGRSIQLFDRRSQYNFRATCADLLQEAGHLMDPTPTSSSSSSSDPSVDAGVGLS